MLHQPARGPVHALLPVPQPVARPTDLKPHPNTPATITMEGRPVQRLS
jgi:hypothetical protein